MAPSKPTSSRSKAASSTKKSKKPTGKIPAPKQQKSKRPGTSTRPPSAAKKNSKQKKSYTAEELGIASLNGIVPAGVTKPKGKKKGKVFVDDQERMMMILAVVNAEAEGKVESKIMRQRQLEEVREARRIEAEKRDSQRKGVLEDAKKEIRSKKKHKGKKAEEDKSSDAKTPEIRRKRVTFAA